MSSPLLVCTHVLGDAELAHDSHSLLPLPIHCCTPSGISLLALSPFLSPCPLFFLAALVFLGL